MSESWWCPNCTSLVFFITHHSSDIGPHAKSWQVVSRRSGCHETYKFRSRITDSRHSSITDQRYDLASLQALHYSILSCILIELVVAYLRLFPLAPWEAYPGSCAYPQHCQPWRWKWHQGNTRGKYSGIFHMSWVSCEEFQAWLETKQRFLPWNTATIYSQNTYCLKCITVNAFQWLKFILTMGVSML